MAKTAFVIGITNDWTFAAANVMFGLKKHRSKPFDLIILHNGISESNQEQLNSIIPCKFVLFDRDFGSTEKFERVSRMAFSRFEMLGMLDNYEYMMWLDADVVISGSMDDIEAQCPGKIAMYLHEDTPISVSFAKDVPGYNMEEGCFNDGIFIISNEIRNGDEIRDWMFESTGKYYDYIHSDQAIFNLMLQEFNVAVDNLSINYNCHPGKRCQAEASVVHPWGEGKFWNKFWNEDWDKYYQLWLSIGGEPVEGYAEFKYESTGIRESGQNLFTKLLNRIRQVV